MIVGHLEPLDEGLEALDLVGEAGRDDEQAIGVVDAILTMTVNIRLSLLTSSFLR